MRHAALLPALGEDARHEEHHARLSAISAAEVRQAAEVVARIFVVLPIYPQVLRRSGAAALAGSQLWRKGKEESPRLLLPAGDSRRD